MSSTVREEDAPVTERPMPVFSEPSVTLDDRVELGSTEWVEVASAYAKTLDCSDLTDQTYAVAIHLQKPPAHLCCDSQCTLRFNFSSKQAELVCCGSSEAVQIHVSWDYNEFLWFLLASADDTGQRRSFHSERDFLLTRTLKVEATATRPPPQILRHIEEIFRFMSLRTTTNPDIDNQIDGLGLRSNIDELDDSGYTIVENAFSSDFADEMREEAARNHSTLKEGEGFRQALLLKRGRVWEHAIAHPSVMTFAEHLLGRGFLVYQSDTIVKEAGLDTHPGLHADYGASRVQEPFPEYCVEATAVWAIDDFTREAGPTVFLPGSFRKRMHVPPGTTREGTITLEMEKGSIAFWHGASWHGAMSRSSQGTRTSLHNAYCRQFMRPIEKYDDIDTEILDRNPPIFATLCGLDDPLGKNTYKGPDFKRFQYAASQHYGKA